MAFPTTDRREIVARAQGAEWQRLLKLADPDNVLTEDEREAEAKRLQTEKLRAAGEKGRQSQRLRLAQADRLRHLTDDLLDHVSEMTALLLSVKRVSPCGDSEHRWPDDLDEDATCSRCRLAYPEWSE